MTNRGTQTAGGSRGPVAWCGPLRAVAAAPAMLGSLLLVLVPAGGLGARALPILLIWAGCGVVALTEAGERVTVRAAFGFRRPSPAQAAVLQPLWATALQLANTPVGEAELYVQQARKPNAYAAGGRSVAVTSRVLDDYRAGRLSGEQVVAVLVHELGHHATGATGPMLIAMWLAAPWRGAGRLLFRLGSALSGRPSRRGLAMVGLAAVVIAVVQAVHQGHWLAGGVVAAVALWLVVCPLADAWVCRRAELAADRFAADRGLAIELTAALGALHGPSSSTSGSPPQAARHPPNY
jgi:STE24 endopeptidase